MGVKVYEVVLHIIDIMGEVDEDGVKSVLENARYPNRCIAPHVTSVRSADIGEWSDDHPLNYRDTQEGELRRLFPSAPSRS